MTISHYPPEKLKTLRKRSLLTQRNVAELVGLSLRTIINVESGRTHPLSDTLNKLLNLYAIRIKRLEHYEQLWERDEPESAQGNRPVRQNGMATQLGPNSSDHQHKRVAEDARGGIQGDAESSVAKARKSWATGRTETSEYQKGDVKE